MTEERKPDSFERTGSASAVDLSAELAALRTENRRLRLEKKIVAMFLIAAGFVLLFYSFASGRARVHAEGGFSQPAQSVGQGFNTKGGP